MSVLNHKALREQLSIIMEALTKAAVVEICEVVDESFAALQMEISRSHKENDDLKKKLHLIQSIVIRGGSGLQAEEQAEVGGGGAEPQQGGEAGGGAERPREELMEIVLIKDEDTDCSESEDGENKAERESPDGGAVVALGDAVSPASVARLKKRSSNVSEKSAEAHKTAKLSAGPQKGPVYTVDLPPSPLGCPGEPAAVASPYSDPDVRLVQECSGGQMFFLEAQSESSPAELDLTADPAWKRFHQSESVDRDAFGLKLVSVSGSASSDCQLSNSSGATFEYDSSADGLGFGLYGDPPGPSALHKKRFACSVCSKTYATAQNLDVHMRIHTGERPFACNQCGKKFTQSAHLRSHLNVHTGKRPFSCTVCARSFIVKYSLKLHMMKFHSQSGSPQHKDQEAS